MSRGRPVLMASMWLHVDRINAFLRNMPGSPEGPAHIPFRERLACSVSDASKATGLSRSLLYIKMKAGEIKWIKVGARRLIKVPSLLRLMDE